MGRIPIRWVELEDRADERGSCFPVPAANLGLVGRLGEAHLITILPGHVRGNHLHDERRELLLVLHSDRWSLHWSTGAEAEIRRQEFHGSGAVSVEIEPGCAHALRNDGTQPLLGVSLSDRPPSPDRTDTHRRVLCDPRA